MPKLPNRCNMLQTRVATLMPACLDYDASLIRVYPEHAAAMTYLDYAITLELSVLDSADEAALKRYYASANL